MGRRRLTALDRGSPGHRASRRIGEWPGKVSRRRGPSAQHSREVWETARGGMVSRARGLWEETAGDAVAFQGQIDLAFLATVAGHLRRCEKCWRPWIDGETPVELITRAVERIPAGQVFRVLVKEIRAQQAPGRRRGGK
jgi:hypothetical protein